MPSLYQLFNHKGAVGHTQCRECGLCHHRYADRRIALNGTDIFKLPHQDNGTERRSFRSITSEVSSAPTPGMFQRRYYGKQRFRHDVNVCDDKSLALIQRYRPQQVVDFTLYVGLVMLTVAGVVLVDG